MSIIVYPYHINTNQIISESPYNVNPGQINHALSTRGVFSQ